MNDTQNNIIISKLVNKIRDKNNNIIGYDLIDQQGRKAQFKSNDLKSMIRAGQIKVIGLTLTKDGRLVNGATEQSEVYSNKIKYETVALINIHDSLIGYIVVDRSKDVCDVQDISFVSKDDITKLNTNIKDNQVLWRDCNKARENQKMLSNKIEQMIPDEYRYICKNYFSSDTIRESYDKYNHPHDEMIAYHLIDSIGRLTNKPEGIYRGILGIPSKYKTDISLDGLKCADNPIEYMSKAMNPVISYFESDKNNFFKDEIKYFKLTISKLQQVKLIGDFLNDDKYLNKMLQCGDWADIDIWYLKIHRWYESILENVLKELDKQLLDNKDDLNNKLKDLEIKCNKVLLNLMKDRMYDEEYLLTTYDLRRMARGLKKDCEKALSSDISKIDSIKNSDKAFIKIIKNSPLCGDNDIVYTQSVNDALYLYIESRASDMKGMLEDMYRTDRLYEDGFLQICMDNEYYPRSKNMKMLETIMNKASTTEVL